MLDNFSGATRVYFIVGDPIAQVKSPFGVTQAFEQHGKDAVCIPAQVPSQDLKQWFEGVSLMRNIDGIIVTVPHKFDCHALCTTSSPRAEFLGAVNTIRRNKDGSWHGDMFDGLAYVKAIESKGFDLRNKTALLVGAGGAGSAIAHSLVLAGIKELAIQDENTERRDSLIHRLNSLKHGRVYVGSSNLIGFDVAINATPVGMRETDPSPFDLSTITPNMFIGCVITAPRNSSVDSCSACQRLQHHDRRRYVFASPRTHGPVLIRGLIHIIFICTKISPPLQNILIPS
jgi:shikimate dehydrogenase